MRVDFLIFKSWLAGVLCWWVIILRSYSTSYEVILLRTERGGLFQILELFTVAAAVSIIIPTTIKRLKKRLGCLKLINLHYILIPTRKCLNFGSLRSFRQGCATRSSGWWGPLPLLVHFLHPHCKKVVRTWCFIHDDMLFRWLLHFDIWLSWRICTILRVLVVRYDIFTLNSNMSPIFLISTLIVLLIFSSLNTFHYLLLR